MYVRSNKSTSHESTREALHYLRTFRASALLYRFAPSLIAAREGSHGIKFPYHSDTLRTLLSSIVPRIQKNFVLCDSRPNPPAMERRVRHGTRSCGRPNSSLLSLSYYRRASCRCADGNIAYVHEGHSYSCNVFYI